MPKPDKLRLVQALIHSNLSIVRQQYREGGHWENSKIAETLPFALFTAVDGARSWPLYRIQQVKAECRIVTCGTVTTGEPLYLTQGCNMLQDMTLYFPRIALEFEKRSFSYFRTKIFTGLNGDLGIVMSSNSFKFKINEWHKLFRKGICKY